MAIVALMRLAMVLRANIRLGGWVVVSVLVVVVGGDGDGIGLQPNCANNRHLQISVFCNQTSWCK